MPIVSRLVKGAHHLRAQPYPCAMALAALTAGAFGGGWPLLSAGAVICVGLVLAPLADPEAHERQDGITGLGLRTDLVDALEANLHEARRTGLGTATMVLEIEHFRQIETQHDRRDVERILRITADRLVAALEADTFARLEGATFAVALATAGDLGQALRLAGHVQRTLSEPIALGGRNLHPTISVGLALQDRTKAPTGESMLQAATIALLEAQRSGPGAIRSYSDAMRARIGSRDDLVREVAGALDRGEIRPFFQPQVCARTGDLSGFETLARWQHPSRGLIPPMEFLPAVEEAGLMGRLGEVMLQSALRALHDWDSAGVRVPHVGVNLSSTELRDPRLVDRISWELDRFDLSADRLVIEVLETVVAAHSDDMLIRNLAGLAKIGCCLDLDDFGTGHASITTIRRFSIERIKIDRSFVTRIDEDPEQQGMVAAILTMADRLGLDTVAEGVETRGEQSMLAQLGCGHVQGFGIARPMPFANTSAWIRAWDDRNEAGPPRQLRAV
ncbi:putative bifunctional diguanylate cyclase/phosphodiesterase [Rubellimicrobium arenae]|uniref:putative bifunctional diguanylate cyclase/phosphodiesterase n=1 Tax=Rubellimicrobium arenae TaxID=2817372 RepID=UPI001B301652|nr:bifunctional diguanylate cyclase/phosphodiesterase [Rubellimicrobium arenae]